MLGDLPLAFGEYRANGVQHMSHKMPTLAEISQVVFDHMSTRGDAVLFGSHAVNAYVEPPRMTADIDILSTDARGVAEDLRELLAKTAHVAVRVRTVAHGRGFRVYQVRKPGNRHLVDVRQVDKLPTSKRIEGVRVVIPSELVVLKLESYAARKRTEKGLTDKVDLYRLLRVFPQLRSDRGPVADRLVDAPLKVRSAWDEILNEPIESGSSDDDADAW